MIDAYAIKVGYKPYFIDTETLEILGIDTRLSRVFDNDANQMYRELIFKVPKIVDDDLMIYLSSEHCLKVFYKGYEHIIKIDIRSYSAFYVNNEYYKDILIFSGVYNLCACKLSKAVFVYFYGFDFLIYETKAYALNRVHGKYALKTAIDLSKFSEDHRLLAPYFVDFVAEGNKIDSKKFKRKLVLESI